jgi:hypothetical protein
MMVQRKGKQIVTRRDTANIRQLSSFDFTITPPFDFHYSDLHNQPVGEDTVKK